MATNKIIMDTHTHTRASDGSFTPEEGVAYAASVGLKILAKTDHDTVFGNDQAIEAGKKYGVQVIPGIEIDATHYDSASGAKVKGIELLGLNVDSEKMQSFCKRISDIRFSVVEFAINAFNQYIASNTFIQQNQIAQFPLQHVVPITLDAIVQMHNDHMQYENPRPFLSKTTVMKYIALHFMPESKTQYDLLNGERIVGNKFKDEYGFLYQGQTQKISFYEAIDAVKAAGGKAVLAHPGRSDGYKNGMIPAWNENILAQNPNAFTPEDFVKDLVAHGLDGLELYNYNGTDAKHANQETTINNYFANLADKYHLIVTYGSDCHGHTGNGPQMGKFGADFDYSHLL